MVSHLHSLRFPGRYTALSPHQTKRMCDIVFYSYDCGHSLVTTYKCSKCPDTKETCRPPPRATSPAPAQEKDKSFLRRKKQQPSSQRHATPLDEPCHICTTGLVAPVAARSIFDTRPMSPAEVEEQESDEEILTWRRDGFIGVHPLRSRKLANTPPIPRRERSIRDMWQALSRMVRQGEEIRVV